MQELVADPPETVTGTTDPSGGRSGREVTRVTVYLPTKVWQRVGTYAKEHGVTKTDALRRAISLLWFVHNRPGGRLLYEGPDGVVEQLVFDTEA